MRKAVIVTGLMTIGVCVGLGMVVVPDGLAMGAAPLAAIVCAVIVIVALCVGIGLLMRRRLERRFNESLAGFDFRFELFYGRQYAHGQYRGHTLSVSLLRVTRGDLAPLLPGGSHLGLMARIKIPGTAGSRLHCAVVPGGVSPALREFTGWENPESGLFVHPVKGQSSEEAMAICARLSLPAREGMRAIAAESGGNCGIMPDWETVLIGRNNALALVDRDEGLLACLELQILMPLAGAAVLRAALDRAVGVVDILAADLAGVQTRRYAE